MIVLLAAGVGVSVLGLLAIGFGIPISDSSFGNALLIAGVVILCTGLILIGMWFVGRELARIAKLLEREAPSDLLSIRPSARPDAEAGSFAPPVAEPTFPSATASLAASQEAGAPSWTDEMAARSRDLPQETAHVSNPAEPVAPSPAASDRPGRRNLLFSTRRREKPDTPLATSALESEPRTSFDSAWPSPSRSSAAERGTAARPTAPAEVAAGPSASRPDRTAPDQATNVTVLKSGVVDGMAYTLYSDGSIEAQMAGEGVVRFASLDALRAYLDQRQ
jgi:hypothetical protein